MRPAWYLLPLSYLWDIPIEKKRSEYSGTVEISLHKGQWKLSTYNAIYSFGKHYTSYQIAFRKLKIKERNIQNVLLLGVGLGSNVKLLLDHPTIQSITAIDIDTVIMELAQKYWPDTQGKFKTNFHTTDALDWLEENRGKQKFDLILSDVFIEDKTPDNILSKRYLELVKKNLTPDGLLLYSKINFTDSHKKDNKLFEKTFFEVFEKGYPLSAQYNLMYVAENI